MRYYMVIYNYGKAKKLAHLIWPPQGMGCVVDSTTAPTRFSNRRPV